MDQHWIVRRWSGRRTDEPRIIFRGPEDLARLRYQQAYLEMRQGSVELLDGAGERVAYQWAPRFRLRTRW